MTNAPVRIGIQIQPQHAEWADMRAAVLEAEELGADIAFTWDHFYPLNGDPDGKHFEAYAILAAWAEATERIEIGALVTCNSYRNPELLADISRTIDHISGGRFVLGIGAGWKEKDYDEYGYDFGTPGTRLAALGEALPRIEKRFAKLNPLPTRHIPVLIGGGGEKKTLRLVARHADIWHGFGDVEEVIRKHRIIDEWCAVEGRNPADISRSVTVSGDPSKDGGAYLDAGTRLFVLSTSGPKYDIGQIKDWIAFRDDHNNA